MLDESTRIKYTLYVPAVFDMCHLLQRRVPGIFGMRWKTTAWIQNSIINGSTNWEYLVHWLKWAETEESKYRKVFNGYPTQNP